MNVEYAQGFCGIVMGCLCMFGCCLMYKFTWWSQFYAGLLEALSVVVLISVANRFGQVAYICWGIGIVLVIVLVGRICKYITRT